MPSLTVDVGNATHPSLTLQQPAVLFAIQHISKFNRNKIIQKVLCWWAEM